MAYSYYYNNHTHKFIKFHFHPPFNQIIHHVPASGMQSQGMQPSLQANEITNQICTYCCCNNVKICAIS